MMAEDIPTKLFVWFVLVTTVPAVVEGFVAALLSRQLDRLESADNGLFGLLIAFMLAALLT